MAAYSGAVIPATRMASHFWQSSAMKPAKSEAIPSLGITAPVYVEGITPPICTRHSAEWT